MTFFKNFFESGAAALSRRFHHRHIRGRIDGKQALLQIACAAGLCFFYGNPAEAGPVGGSPAGGETPDGAQEEYYTADLIYEIEEAAKRHATAEEILSMLKDERRGVRAEIRTSRSTLALRTERLFDLHQKFFQYYKLRIVFLDGPLWTLTWQISVLEKAFHLISDAENTAGSAKLESVVSQEFALAAHNRAEAAYDEAAENKAAQTDQSEVQDQEREEAFGKAREAYEQASDIHDAASAFVNISDKARNELLDLQKELRKELLPLYERFFNAVLIKKYEEEQEAQEQQEDEM